MSLIAASELTLHHALVLADSHYENFPTASFLLSKRYRQVVRLIYAFARTADDIADEGSYSDEWRLTELATMHRLLSQPAGHPFFVALVRAVQAHDLSIELLHDLLFAFEHDVKNKRYPTFKSVLRYCHFSARPVGRLLLQLHQQNSPLAYRYSDALCCALQLLNFLQDIESDFSDRNRIYIPQSSLLQYDVPEHAFSEGHANLVCMLSYELDRAQRLLNKGALLSSTLSGRLKAQTSLTVAAGQQVANHLAKRKEPLACPRLKWYDWPIIGIKAISDYVT